MTRLTSPRVTGRPPWQPAPTGGRDCERTDEDTPGQGSPHHRAWHRCRRAPTTRRRCRRRHRRDTLASRRPGEISPALCEGSGEGSHPPSQPSRRVRGGGGRCGAALSLGAAVVACVACVAARRAGRAGLVLKRRPRSTPSTTRAPSPYLRQVLQDRLGRPLSFVSAYRASTARAPPRSRSSSRHARAAAAASAASLTIRRRLRRRRLLVSRSPSTPLRWCGAREKRGARAHSQNSRGGTVAVSLGNVTVYALAHWCERACTGTCRL